MDGLALVSALFYIYINTALHILTYNWKCRNCNDLRGWQKYVIKSVKRVIAETVLVVGSLLCTPHYCHLGFGIAYHTLLCTASICLPPSFLTADTGKFLSFFFSKTSWIGALGVHITCDMFVNTHGCTVVCFHMLTRYMMCLHCWNPTDNPCPKLCVTVSHSANSRLVRHTIQPQLHPHVPSSSTSPCPVPPPLLFLYPCYSLKQAQHLSPRKIIGRYSTCNGPPIHPPRSF